MNTLFIIHPISLLILNGQETKTRGRTKLVFNTKQSKSGGGTLGILQKYS